MLFTFVYDILCPSRQTPHDYLWVDLLRFLANICFTEVLLTCDKGTYM